MKQPQETPLIAIAEQFDTERGALCRLVERACAAIGFPPGCQYERVAAYIARVAGLGALRATTARITRDRSIDCTADHVRRALATLAEEGLLIVTSEPSPPTRKRGRPPTLYRLAIDWENARRIVREFDEWEATMRAEVLPPTHSGDFPTSSRREAGAAPTMAQRAADIGPTSGDPLLSPPNNPSTHGPQPPSRPPSNAQTAPRRIETADHKRTPEGGFTRGQLEPIAGRILAALAWPAGDAQTVWRIAAAFRSGDLSEADVADSCRAAVACRARDPVAYMRTTLAGRLDLDRGQMRAFLSRYRCQGGFPEEPPQRQRPAATIKRPPAADAPHAADIRRQLEAAGIHQ